MPFAVVVDHVAAGLRRRGKAARRGRRRSRPRHVAVLRPRAAPPDARRPRGPAVARAGGAWRAAGAEVVGRVRRRVDRHCPSTQRRRRDVSGRIGRRDRSGRIRRRVGWDGNVFGWRVGRGVASVRRRGLVRRDVVGEPASQQRRRRPRQRQRQRSRRQPRRRPRHRLWVARHCIATSIAAAAIKHTSAWRSWLVAPSREARGSMTGKRRPGNTPRGVRRRPRRAVPSRFTIARRPGCPTPTRSSRTSAGRSTLTQADVAPDARLLQGLEACLRERFPMRSFCERQSSRRAPRSTRPRVPHDCLHGNHLAARPPGHRAGRPPEVAPTAAPDGSWPRRRRTSCSGDPVDDRRGHLRHRRRRARGAPAVRARAGRGSRRRTCSRTGSRGATGRIEPLRGPRVEVRVAKKTRTLEARPPCARWVPPPRSPARWASPARTPHAGLRRRGPPRRLRAALRPARLAGGAPRATSW